MALPPLILACYTLGSTSAHSNGSITDGPVACDKLPSTAGQQNQLSCQEFGFGNNWAKTSKIGHTTWVGPKKQSPIEDGLAHFSRDMAPIMYCTH